MLKFLLKLRNRTAKRGFTLIELLVVVAIIGLLAAFAVPRLFQAINDAKKTPAKADLRTIASALDRYYMDKNAYPVAASMKTELAGYLKGSTRFYNGFDKGYIYLTDGSGSFYVLIDAENQATTAALTLTCNAKVEGNLMVGNKDLSPVVAAVVTGADVAKGCSITAGAGTNTATVVTN